MRVGVIGTLVWDTIYGRDQRATPIEEWGGITYGLSGLDAALPSDWEIVPIIKVGSDLAARARAYLRTLKRISRDAELVEVPYPNHRVELRYSDDERRTEKLTGHLPGWTWAGLKPLLDSARLDALYVNFLSGWELDLETTQLLRRAFSGPIYCDIHMMVWAVQPDGVRTLRPLPNVREWAACFDLIQVNEDEMRMLAPDPMALAATALHAGTSCLVVTLGKRGAVYFAAPQFDRLDVRHPKSELSAAPGAMRTALVPAVPLQAGDPTGCGDVWGATYFARLLSGDNLGVAIQAAHRAAARNYEHRGAGGLANHLRGQLSVT